MTEKTSNRTVVPNTNLIPMKEEKTIITNIFTMNYGLLLQGTAAIARIAVKNGKEGKDASSAAAGKPTIKKTSEHARFFIFSIVQFSLKVFDAVVGKQHFLFVDDRFEMDGFPPKLVNVRKDIFQMFQVQFDAFVFVL